MQTVVFGVIQLTRIQNGNFAIKLNVCIFGLKKKFNFCLDCDKDDALKALLKTVEDKVVQKLSLMDDILNGFGG